MFEGFLREAVAMQMRGACSSEGEVESAVAAFVAKAEMEYTVSGAAAIRDEVPILLEGDLCDALGNEGRDEVPPVARPGHSECLRWGR